MEFTSIRFFFCIIEPSVGQLDRYVGAYFISPAFAGRCGVVLSSVC